MNIVITTINEPTAAVRMFLGMSSVSSVIMIGDKKTPQIQSKGKLRYYDVEEQNNLFPTLANALPLNHYCRKMIGYLLASSGNCDFIYDTDDDNFPYDNWGLPDINRITHAVTSPDRWINIYKCFCDENIWPRGLPLSEVRKKKNFDLVSWDRNEQIALIQSLADNEPDVDAIYRLVLGDQVRFEKDRIYAVMRSVYSPFNSQNTYWRSSFLRLMYLPVTVSFRFTDILRSYVAQKLIWKQGAIISFSSPTVYQVRNQHDLMRDFMDEVPVYERCNDVVDALERTRFSGDLDHDMLSTYKTLVGIGVCAPAELKTLSIWLETCKALDRAKY
jgi:hypothetical protein